jgi:hypothetical protein
MDKLTTNQKQNYDAIKAISEKMRGIIPRRPIVTDWTNDEQIKTAIMANISDSMYPHRGARYAHIPNLSDSLQIAHRVQFEDRLGRHSHIVDIERCLHQLVTENLIEYSLCNMGNGVIREWYGPLAMTDAEIADWNAVRQRWANA